MIDSHALAAKLTDKNIENLMNYWEENDKQWFDMANSLVRLGDSIKLAVATTLNKKYKESTFSGEDIQNLHYS